MSTPSESLPPDHLPRLDWGSHRPGDGRFCVMEAAAWLAGEQWSDHPRSVHRAVASVARRVNDGVSDDVRQTLWSLVLASLDTARPRHPVLSFRMSRYAAKAMSTASRHGDLPRAWRDILDEHIRLFGDHQSTVPRERVRSLAAHGDRR